MIYTDNKFRSTSINITSFLIAHGFELLGKESDPHDGRRVLFVLRDQPVREALTNNFLIGKGGNVDIHRLLAAQKQLKQLIYD